MCNAAPNAGFKTYWQTHGLADRQLSPYGRSLALFGLPLTPAFVTTNEQGDRVLTQWFERARFEWHPNKPSAFRVSLGLLGTELARPQALNLQGSIAYSVSTEAGRAIEIVELNGAKARITPPDADQLAPAWSPDGQFVAYMQSDQVYFTLRRARRDGSEQQQLTTTAYPDQDCTVRERQLGFSATDPAWSPDGRLIAFAGGDNQRNDTCLYLMHADGSTITNLTPEEGPRRFAAPTWSPDGQYLAVSTYDGIFVMRPDGTARRQLVDTPDIDTGPAWSPDGRHIAFVAVGADTADAFVIDAHSGKLQRLTYSPGFVRRLAWSPDGRYLLLVQANSDGNDQLAAMPFEAKGGPALLRQISTASLGIDISSQAWRER